MSNLFCRNPNASEFRGAAHDLIVSRIIFSNLPKLSKIVAGMPQVSTICANYTVPAETSQAIYFHELCKKYLTSSAYYCIIGAARLALLKTNAQLPQKVLDNSGPCAYTTRVGTGSSRDQRVELFWAIVQKVLDSIDPALYNRRGAFIRPKQFKKILSNRAKKT